MSLLKSKKLKSFLEIFENNINRHNYNNLCNYIKKKVVKIRKIFKSYNFLLTDKSGVLIYNSENTNNTFENYEKGNIKYNSISDTNFINKGEKIGNATVFILKRSGYFKMKNVKKLGSEGLEKIEENPESLQSILVV